MELAMGQRPMTGPDRTTDLPSLTSFTITIRYSRAETALDVHTPGHSMPVARVVKNSHYGSRHPFHVLTGPGLDQLAGYVTPFAAYSPDRARIGTVTSRHRVLRPDRWQIDQHNLGALPAHPAGTSRIRYTFPLSLLLAGNITNAILPFTFRFHSPQSPGFTITRKAGLRARFTTTVHDPQIDRRLILAAVVGLNQYESADLRQEAVDLTTNPFTA
jgi:hypothetical protein